MNNKPKWTVLKPGGTMLVMTDGACAWDRRADAMNAAEIVGMTSWPALKESGWSLRKVRLTDA